MFFFKQKTAYDMRISDWSSDVCSSDLHAVARDVDDVVDATGDPVVAVGVAPAAGTAEVLAGIGREVGLHEALMVAVDRAHLARPGVGDAEVALGGAFELLALGIDDDGSHAEERPRGRARLQIGSASCRERG